MTSINASKSINDHPWYLDAPVNACNTSPALNKEDSDRISSLKDLLCKRAHDLRQQAEMLELHCSTNGSFNPSWELDAYRALFDSLAAGTISR